MHVFVCDSCNRLENTALSYYWCRKDGEPALCSQCDPTIKRWHGKFERRVWDGNIEGICNKDPKEFGYSMR
jgi:hypothetical protein